MLKKLESEAAKLEEQDAGDDFEANSAVESSYLAMLKVRLPLILLRDAVAVWLLLFLAMLKLCMYAVNMTKVLWFDV